MASKGDLGSAAETNGLVKSDVEMTVLREGEQWRRHNRRVRILPCRWTDRKTPDMNKDPGGKVSKFRSDSERERIDGRGF